MHGCRGPHSQNPKDYDSSLIVLDNAKDVRFAKYYKTDQVSYHIAVNYPASGVIEEIASRLKATGWVALTEDYLNQGIKSSLIRGWGYFIDGTKNPNEEVHQWMADWQNDKRDIVRYSLRYSYPINGKKDMTNLLIVVIYSPAEVVNENKRIIKKPDK